MRKRSELICKDCGSPDLVQTGRSPYCRICKNIRMRQFHYGMNGIQFETMFMSQCGKCAICTEVFDFEIRGKEPCIDHDHSTNQIRGLLCHSCNKGIGLLRDSSEMLDASAEYLRQHACLS